MLPESIPVGFLAESIPVGFFFLLCCGLNVSHHACRYLAVGPGPSASHREPEKEKQKNITANFFPNHGILTDFKPEFAQRPSPSRRQAVSVVQGHTVTMTVTVLPRRGIIMMQPRRLAPGPLWCFGPPARAGPEPAAAPEPGLAIWCTAAFQSSSSMLVRRGPSGH